MSRALCYYYYLTSRDYYCNKVSSKHHSALKGADSKMRGHQLCLLTWTIAVGVITGSHGQCATNNPTPELLATIFARDFEFHLSPSHTNDTSCQWLISSRNSARLHLVLTPQLRSDNGSCVDNIKVYDGNSSSSPILLSTCSRNVLPIYSSGSDVLVSFTAGNDDTDNNSSFIIQYRTFQPRRTSCSSYEVLNATNIPQDMDYTSDPISFDYTDRCWTIERDNSSSIISVNFTEVHMDSCGQQNCSCDTVEVMSGGTLGFKTLGEVCGELGHHVFNTSQQFLYISLRPSLSYTRRHFRLTYWSFYREDTKSNISISPGQKYHLSYPGNMLQYPNNTDRGWVFHITNPQYVLHLNLTFMDIQWASAGCYDYIEIFDSSLETKRLDRLCGVQAGRQYYSTGQTLYIKFHSDNSVSRKGFNLTCEAVLREAVHPTSAVCNSSISLVAFLGQQQLKYPPSSNMYLNNAYSCWLFETFNSNTVIKITLNTDVEPSSSACSGNYIEVFDGSSQVNKLGRLCGRQEGKQYFSTGQSMFLTFHRDNNQTTGGFTLTYQAVSVPSVNWTECNSLHTQVRTVDHSPRYLMYPGNQTNYTNNADCGWLLQTSSYLQDFLIHVTFSFIDTENTNGCDYDYVEIFDGSTSLSNKLTRLCGHMGRREVYSSGQSLFIRFHSDDSNTGRGFSMMYQAISSPDAHPDTGLACSDQVLPQAAPSRAQYLKYPSDFHLYINNVDCSWLLQARDDTYVVHVTFLSVDIEDNRDCSYDYVEVFAGVDESAVSMGRVCGSTTRDFYSPGINVFIKFHSDSSNNGRGFQLAYQEVPVSSRIPAGSTCPNQVLPQAATSIAQYLTYPVGSLTYLNNVGCSWTLHTSDIGYIVHVVFMMMNTEQSTSCSYDYVQLYDGSNTFASSLGKLCGSTTGEFYSSGRYMYITFHSDGSNTGRGFQLSYREVSASSVTTTVPGSGCSLYSASLTAMIGMVQSLYYPTVSSYYPNNVDCGWPISTDSYDYVVHVTFTFVDTEYSSYCTYDFIEVFDGSSDSANSLGRLCGSTTRDFYSSGQDVFIKFHSDGSTTGQGFRLTYQAVASGDVPKSSGDVLTGVTRPYIVAGAVLSTIVVVLALIAAIVRVTVRRRSLQQTTQNISSPIRTISQNPPYSNLRNDFSATHPHFSVVYEPPPYDVVCQSGTTYPGASGYIMSGQQQHPPNTMATTPVSVTTSASQGKSSPIN